MTHYNDRTDNENSQANLRPHQFKSGAEWNGNAKGGRRLGATVRDWWNSLSRENDDGVPKYSMKQIEAFADAPSDDESVSPAKKIAARQIVEMAKGGRTGREIMALVFDRTEGRAPQSLNLTAGPEMKRIILVDERAVAVHEALPEADGG